MTALEAIEKFAAPLATQVIGAANLLLLWAIRKDFDLLKQAQARDRCLILRIIKVHSTKYPGEAFDLLREDAAEGPK